MADGLLGWLAVLVQHSRTQDLLLGDVVGVRLQASLQLHITTASLDLLQEGGLWTREGLCAMP